MNDNIPIENVEIASNNIFVISEYLISELSVVFCIISIITDTDHTRSYKINIIKNEYINVVTNFVPAFLFVLLHRHR